MGDCGGLKGGVFWIGSVIMSSFSSFSMENLLLTTLFRVITSSKISNKDADVDLVEKDS